MFTAKSPSAVSVHAGEIWRGGVPTDGGGAQVVPLWLQNVIIAAPGVWWPLTYDDGPVCVALTRPSGAVVAAGGSAQLEAVCVTGLSPADLAVTILASAVKFWIIV